MDLQVYGRMMINQAYLKVLEIDLPLFLETTKYRVINEIEFGLIYSFCFSLFSYSFAIFEIFYAIFFY